MARAVYHNLPLNYAHKRRLKNYVYKSFRFIDRISASYQHWRVRRSKDWSSRATPASFQQSMDRSAVTGSSVVDRPQSERVERGTEDTRRRDGVESLPDPTGGPDVSIIIPVYNQLDFTLQCLESIATTPTQIRFELIVVDDASQDDTATVLSVRRDIRYLRNEDNRGFIKTCNRGAAEANGKYLLFLNNDTTVVSGWLDELVRTFHDFEDAGLVGSKLLYPDGRLQEAGGIIWNDGSGCNYGRDDDPDKPQYNYLREVDYVSGASIMVPKDLFDQLGGFDDHYAPAYYEDTDLAFKIRQFGLKVLYQPLSRVIHYEGVTSGTDIFAGVKAYQTKNAQKFHERWRETLSAHGAPGKQPDIQRDRGVGSRVFLVDTYTPTPDRDSGSMDTFQMIKILQSLSYKVTFVPHDLAFLGRYTEDLQRIGVECLYSPHVKSVESHLKKCGEIYDVVILFRADNAAYYIDHVRKYCPNAKIIFDTVDVHHLREMRQAELENSARLRRQAAETKKVELDLMNKADATIFLSSAEYSMLAKEATGAKLFLIPFFRDVPGRSSGFSPRRDIVFVGGFKHQPNVDAVKFFVRDIFPLIKQHIPELKFYIIGSNPTPEVYDLSSDDVVVTGYVKELSEHMNRCRLSVAPLRYGSGIKGKVASSLGYGVPCVATPIAVEGMEIEAGQDILVAENPRSFADAVIKLYSDQSLWQKLSDNGLAYVEDRFSISRGQIRVARMLSDVNAKPFHGTCNVCGFTVSFEITSDNFRESLNCPKCGSSSRNRCLAEGLLRMVINSHAESIRELAKQDLDIHILDTDNFGAMSKFLKGRKFYSTSMYFPNQKNGKKLGRGVWNVDLMKMPFDDATFDAIITSDVMEHVRRDVPAHKEIFRCLKPGGSYVFTVPYVPTWEKNQIRVDSTGDTDVFLMEKEYHSDPLGAEGILVYRIYGRELYYDLKSIGFSTVKFESLRKPENGILLDGLWICTK